MSPTRRLPTCGRSQQRSCWHRSFESRCELCGSVVMAGQANPLPTLIFVGRMGQPLGRPNVAHLHAEIFACLGNRVTTLMPWKFCRIYVTVDLLFGQVQTC
jgi:hypothetical protein